MGSCAFMQVGVCILLVSVCLEALAGIESHCLQLVRPPRLPSAAVRKSNAPLFPPLNFCHSPLIMSSALKRNEKLGRKCQLKNQELHLFSVTLATRLLLCSRAPSSWSVPWFCRRANVSEASAKQLSAPQVATCTQNNLVRVHVGAAGVPSNMWVGWRCFIQRPKELLLSWIPKVKVLLESGASPRCNQL